MEVGKNRTVATVVISCMRDEVSAKLIKIISERATSRRGDLGEVPRPAAARAVPPPWYNHTSNETQVVSLLRTQKVGPRACVPGRPAPRRWKDIQAVERARSATLGELLPARQVLPPLVQVVQLSWQPRGDAVRPGPLQPEPGYHGRRRRRCWRPQQLRRACC